MVDVLRTACEFIYEVLKLVIIRNLEVSRLFESHE